MNERHKMGIEMPALIHKVAKEPRFSVLPFQNQIAGAGSLSIPPPKTPHSPSMKLDIDERLLGRHVVRQSDVEHEIFEDEAALNTFKTVAAARRLNRRDLVGVLGSKGLEEDAVYESLELLRQEGLIERREAPINDFDMYYVTAKGLSAQRRLRHSNSD